MALLRLSMLLLPSAAVALSSRMMKDSCRDYQCSEGWVANADADTLVGNELHRNSDEKCCDRTCALYTCPEEFAWNPKNEDLIAKHGHERDTCCLPLCKRYTCEEGYSADPRKQDKTYDPLKGDEDTCCLPLCKHYTCEEGWGADPRKQDKTYDPRKGDRDTCCLPLCKQYFAKYKCEEGWEADPAQQNKTYGPGSGEVHCCKPKPPPMEVKDSGRKRWGNWRM